jgi:modulator of FtsH protease HflC
VKTHYIVISLVILILAYSSTYIVNETEQVVITEFGKSIGNAEKEPGLKFKLPYQKVNRFSKNLQEWDGEPGQISTLDKTFLSVDSFARWKIVDPLKFFQTVNNLSNAYGRLDDILDSAVRNLITSNSLIETVRMTNREMDTFEVGLDNSKEQNPIGEIKVGRQKITNEILAQAKPKLEKFGIELVDFKIKGLNYVEDVQQSVYARMTAERKQIAEKYRSEGQGEARKIEGDMEKDLKKITSEAYKSAEEIKGKADGEAALIYAKAFGNDPEFYSFLQTLDIYKDSIGKDSTIILSTDSEFFKYLKGYQGK